MWLLTPSPPEHTQLPPLDGWGAEWTEAWINIFCSTKTSHETQTVANHSGKGKSCLPDWAALQHALSSPSSSHTLTTLSDTWKTLLISKNRALVTWCLMTWFSYVRWEDPFPNFLIQETPQQFSVLAKNILCKGNVLPPPTLSRKEHKNIKSSEDLCYLTAEDSLY